MASRDQTTTPLAVAALGGVLSELVALAGGGVLAVVVVSVVVAACFIVASVFEAQRPALVPVRVTTRATRRRNRIS